MSDIKEVFPLKCFEHNEWLAENEEFLKTHKIPDAIKNKIRGIPLVYKRYVTAIENNEPEKAQKYFDSCKRSSIEIWDELQTWRETDFPENEEGSQPQESSTENIPAEEKPVVENQPAEEGVELINGKPVETGSPKVVEVKPDETKPNESKPEEKVVSKEGDNNKKEGNSAGGGILTLLGLAAASFFTLKWLTK